MNDKSSATEADSLVTDDQWSPDKTYEDTTLTVILASQG